MFSFVTDHFGAGSPIRTTAEFPIRDAQHTAHRWRLRAVETDFRSLAAVLTRTAAMLLIAVLLILVLLPAVLAASSR